MKRSLPTLESEETAREKGRREVAGRRTEKVFGIVMGVVEMWWGVVRGFVVVVGAVGGAGGWV